MQLEINKCIKSLQLLKPNLGYAFKMLQDPRSNEVTRISILVFLKRFAPEYPLKTSDAESIFKFLGIESL